MSINVCRCVLDFRCEFYLGSSETELIGKSWYEFISPETLGSAAKHHSEGTLTSLANQRYYSDACVKISFTKI